jgi:hypothetical protein
MRNAWRHLAPPYLGLAALAAVLQGAHAAGAVLLLGLGAAGAGLAAAAGVRRAQAACRARGIRAADPGSLLVAGRVDAVVLARRRLARAVGRAPDLVVLPGGREEAALRGLGCAVADLDGLPLLLARGRCVAGVGWSDAPPPACDLTVYIGEPPPDPPRPTVALPRLADLALLLRLGRQLRRSELARAAACGAAVVGLVAVACGQTTLVWVAGCACLAALGAALLHNFTIGM